jgi:hypothetical protein
MVAATIRAAAIKTRNRDDTLLLFKEERESMPNLLKRTGVNLILIMGCVLCVSSAKAALMGTASWTFDSAPQNTGTVSGSAFNSTATLAENPANNGNNATTYSFPSTGGDPNGYLLGTSKSGDPTRMNGDTLTFTLTPGSSGAVKLSTLTFNYIRSSDGPTTINWSVGGSASGTVSSTTGLSGSATVWSSTVTVNLSGVTIAAGTTSFTITGDLEGAVAGTTGTIGFDNFVITSVPEPINYALACFGVLLVGGSAGRFYLARRAA